MTDVHANAVKPTALVLHTLEGAQTTATQAATYAPSPRKYTAKRGRARGSRSDSGISSGAPRTTTGRTVSSDEIQTGMCGPILPGVKGPGSTLTSARLRTSIGTPNQNRFRSSCV
jgi:hypothetical protein